jgi:arylsulfatase A
MKMRISGTYTHLSILLTICTVGLSQIANGEISPKKNIILILADDIGYDNYSLYGSEEFSTPNLDSLAQNGVYFTRAYSTPVCTPSRVRLMTGRDGRRNYEGFGILPASEITFASMMKQAGYSTAITGKWQLQTDNGDGTFSGVAIEDAGFDTWLMNNTLTAGKARYWQPGFEQDDGTLLPNMTLNDYGPDQCTSFVTNFITAHTNEPFFIYYPMLLVHDPFVPTPDSINPLQTDKNTNYRDMVPYMDKLIDLITDTLDDLGLRENTVILYMGDNGTGRNISYTFNGESRDGEKAYPTDGGTHVALIANCPGTITNGLVCDDLIDFTDILPTLSDIAEAPLPNRVLDGRSFWPQLTGQTGNPKEYIYQYYEAKNQKVKGIYGTWTQWAQDKQYKLYYGQTFTNFYDYVNDRGEDNPLTTLTEEQQTAYDKLLAGIQKAENSPEDTPLGAYKYWEEREFSPTQISTGDSAPSNDFDNDGLTNQEEYLLCTSPTNPNDSAIIQPAVEHNGQHYPVVTFTRRYDTSIATLIEAKTSLTNSAWQNVTADFSLIGRTNQGDGTETVTYKQNLPLSGNTSFFQLRMSGD